MFRKLFLLTIFVLLVCMVGNTFAVDPVVVGETSSKPVCKSFVQRQA